MHRLPSPPAGALGETVQRIEDLVRLPHAVSPAFRCLGEYACVDESVDGSLRGHIADAECPLYTVVVDHRLRHQGVDEASHDGFTTRNDLTGETLSGGG